MPADAIIHLYRVDRPGHVRGVTWYAPVIVTLKDHDEFQDATLMRQKIAACFAGIVTDVGGPGVPVVGKPNSRDPLIEGIEPGMIAHLPPGKQIEFTERPGLTDHASFNSDVLARVAMGLSVTVEDLTGDYRSMPLSAARRTLGQRARLAVQHPDPTWLQAHLQWAMEAMLFAGAIVETPGSEWTPPPMPMIEADKEGRAYQRAVLAGYMTPDEMVRERALDPETHWDEYGRNMKEIRDRGIDLDIDASQRTQAGNAIGVSPDSEKKQQGGSDSKENEAMQ